MDKKVLAIYYSQSGQLGEIIEYFIKPFERAGFPVEKVRITPVTDYPFPWTGERFFRVMPDCVLSVPTALQSFTLKESSYDLIILGYQAWFLSPSIPSNSLLQNERFRGLLKDTPVITITGARNMWMNAFDRVRQALLGAGAKLVGNIALVDRHPNPISFITIFHWMMHGRKDKYLNIFPVPGVAAADIAHTERFGALALPCLRHNDWSGLQRELLKQGAVAYKYKLMFIEARARGIFLAWAKFISARRKKRTWLAAFKYYLLIALFLGAPVLLAVDALFIKPFSTKRIKAKKQYYLELH
ncbi:MAG: hypothetical protein Q8927_08450 [Bacteroidota bacterium]|nr:hypothetical protein [Bacteroidota bacterium]MDP4216218.1 hypothetical protein [Bacteroidota bacterium]MDP4245123.1 hypothetical protein [Bacteroidota bacterium]MDP4253341.1 hypothetical protein [Bacteroidota bacterium]MDP4256784.1 hypothetical protein [Bacteroidota bacterium]